MNEYQKEQRDAIVQIRSALRHMAGHDHNALQRMIEPYLAFRKQVNAFSDIHFSTFCTSSCFTNQLSACCSKDGIITFWADAVVNACCSNEHQMDTLLQAVYHPFSARKCIFLGPQGCHWQVRPLGCAMFLCDSVQENVLAAETGMKNQWDQFTNQAKSYRWPDRPVLFDQLERIFIEIGCQSPIMYLHNSPGLLRLKKSAGLHIHHTG